MELFLVRRGSGEVSWESDPNGRTFHFCVELADVNSTWSKLVRAIPLCMHSSSSISHSAGHVQEALWPELAANPQIRALSVRRKERCFLVAVWEDSAHTPLPTKDHVGYVISAQQCVKRLMQDSLSLCACQLSRKMLGLTEGQLIGSTISRNRKRLKDHTRGKARNANRKRSLARQLADLSLSGRKDQC
jgi:hypothetical protein